MTESTSEKSLSLEPVILYSYGNGTKAYRHEGYLHREDGPAIIYPNGHRVWYYYGKLHRVGGPAMEAPDGRREYHLNGIEYYSKAEYFNRLTKEQQEKLIFDSEFME